jgi:hypothetical protein
MSAFFQSTNVNDILEAAQRITIYNYIFRNTHHQSWHQQAWNPYYVQPDLNNPTLFCVQADESMPDTISTVVWPAAVSADDNPFGIFGAQGDPIFPANLQALVVDISNLNDWTENDGGIGV